MKRPVLLTFLSVLLPGCATYQPGPRPPVSTGTVSAADPRAAAAGVEILRAGGTATDAAIATMLALNVVEPQSSGIGGGSFWVRHAANGRLSTIDARETAPAAATARWFYDDAGRPMTTRDAIPGGRSVGVPGALRGMALAHADGGKLPWARLFGPAIRLARDGWRLTPRFAGGLLANGGHLSPELRQRFTGADGRPLPVDSLVTNPAQAALLERLARQGADSFYVGPQAAKLVGTVNGAARNPSRMTAGDLASYAAKPRDPVCATYRAHRVCSMGPPSSGGITVLTILKQLERFDLSAMGPTSPVSWHLFADSSRLAFADRNLYIGDPDFVAVPVAGLLDPTYLASRSALLSPTAALKTVAAGTPPGAPPRLPVPAGERAGTTDLAVADAAGNVVQVTTTIEAPYGSGLVVDGTILNNELTDFDIVPEQGGYLAANRVEGGKRPRSSMAPTIVYAPDGHVLLAVGAAGGPTIIAQVAKAIVGVVDWKMTAQDAIATGLVFAPGAVVVEQGTDREAQVAGMRALGHEVRVAPLGLKANAIEWRGGRWIGAADPRSEGVAMDTTGAVTTIERVGARAGTPPE